jgi:hypothetical protein
LMRHQLLTVLTIAREIAPAEIAEFLGALECIRVTALARLNAPVIDETDEMLDVHEAAVLLKRSECYVYRHKEKWSFAIQEGRNWRFSKRGIARYLARGTTP